jgi:hypothetical protein
MPREGFSRKRYAVVRLLGWAAAKSYCGYRDDHIDNHGHGSGQDNDCDRHEHARVGFDLTLFDGPIDHAIPARRESCQHSSKAYHASPLALRRCRCGARASPDSRRKTSRASHRLNRAITNPQTHYGDAGPYPGEKRSLVSEHLGFDPCPSRADPFRARICHLDGYRSIINSFC